jgi:hypothetical protein
MAIPTKNINAEKIKGNLSINGVSGTTISATTYLNLPISGITDGVGISTSITDGNVTITNSAPDQTITITGGTNIEINGVYPNFGVNFTGSTGSIFTGGTVYGSTFFTNGLSANTFSATTYLGLPIDIFVTGGTYNNGELQFINNTGGTFNISGLFTGDTDVFVTGGTYSNGDILFTNNTGGTFTVNGLFTGKTDVFVTGGTYNNNNVLIFTNNTGSTFSVLINQMSGLTISNTLLSTTISATTYLGLPIDVFVTGGTYSDGSIFFVNNTGGTFNVSGLVTGDTYWISGSTGLFSLKNKNNSAIDATGNYSHAEGFSTTASGPASHAEGDSSIASGESSHSEGLQTTASGNYSHAEGRQTIASGTYSHAEGFQTTASATASYAGGRLTTASGVYSHAEGFKTTASGQNSFIFSNDSIVLGSNSVLLGGEKLTGITDNTVFVPRLNINTLTGNTAQNNLGVDEDGFVVIKNEFDFSLNFIDPIEYPIILPYNWRVDSVDNFSGITYNITNNLSPYSLGDNISAFTNTIIVSAATTGFINLKCLKLT